jgi:hypothetical protein
MPCHGSILFVYVWCPRGLLYLDGYLFLKIWEVLCCILLNVILMPLAHNSFPFLVPMTHRFGLSMKLQFLLISFIFLYSYFLCSSVCFDYYYIYFVFKSWNSVFHLLQIAGVVFNCIFIWLNKLFYFKSLYLVSFKLPISLLNSPFKASVVFLVSFTYLFVLYCLLCFIYLFICIFLEFIQMFICIIF